MLGDSGLKDKHVLISGGSRGIGRAIVTAFAKERAIVSFLYRQNSDSAAALVDALAAEQQRVFAYQCDVQDKTAVDATVAEMIDAHGPVSVLINNSGITRDAICVGMDRSDLSDVFATNVFGSFYLAQAVIPHMMRQKTGKIINISSVAAEKGGRGQSNYAASKGAINAMTRALATEVARKGITVNAIAPGVIETDMTAGVREMAADEVQSKILLKRYGRPDEIAASCVFLASTFADYITGAVLNVDGGFKMA